MVLRIEVISFFFMYLPGSGGIQDSFIFCFKRCISGTLFLENSVVSGLFQASDSMRIWT